MSEKNALACAYLLDEKGGGKALDWAAIDSWKPEQGLLWIHLDSTIIEAQSWLKEKSGLSVLTCDSLLDRETRPRNIQTDDGLLGINVGGIPRAEFKWAFAVVTAIMFLIGIELILWFKKIRWL